MENITQEEWNQLLTQSPTNDDLRYIIEYGTDEYKDKGVEK